MQYDPLLSLRPLNFSMTHAHNPTGEPFSPYAAVSRDER